MSDDAQRSDTWSTVLWDDEVTLQPYVVHVLMHRFGLARELSLIHI